jgi:hypothetical protein
MPSLARSSYAAASLTYFISFPHHLPFYLTHVLMIFPMSPVTPARRPRHLFRQVVLPITSLFWETSTIQKRVLKKVRAIVKMRINFARLAVAPRADWLAGRNQRSARALQEKGSISTCRCVCSIVLCSLLRWSELSARRFRHCFCLHHQGLMSTSTRLVARWDFVACCCHESFRSSRFIVKYSQFWSSLRSDVVCGYSVYRQC